MLRKLILIIALIPKLGIVSVARVFMYRFFCYTGVYKLLMSPVKWTSRDFFYSPGSPKCPSGISESSCHAVLKRADRLLDGEMVYYNRSVRNIGTPPDWFLDPFKQKRVESSKNWSKINVFADTDVKSIWEASRFEWVTLLGQAWRIGGDDRYIDALNAWLQDWVERNPVNVGIQWKCGQEASIRVFNLLLTAFLLDTNENPSSALHILIERHCDRIAKTLKYAIAQNNNHGISEAAALFIGGAWLHTYATRDSAVRERAGNWEKIGRYWLEDRVNSLIEEDGSFSQYSVNYHRVLLDTLSQVEFWRRQLGRKEFTDSYKSRCRCAVNWLFAFTDPESGDAPNMGANDGAELYSLTTGSYRDYRPSIQLGRALLADSICYTDRVCMEPLEWLEIKHLKSENEPNPENNLYPDGGYAILTRGSVRGIVRFANFNFRPSHADCLHLDLWYKGDNLLRDGGSYKYNTLSRWMDYFSGTKSHNTVQFDGRDQMPKISRFLFGQWLKMEVINPIEENEGCLKWSGSYKDGKKCRHKRTVEIREDGVKIVDEVEGFKKSAVLRWRLKPGDWNLSDSICKGNGIKIILRSDKRIRRCELVKGWESRYYSEKTELPVLEVEIEPDTAVIETIIEIEGQ